MWCELRDRLLRIRRWKGKREGGSFIFGDDSPFGSIRFDSSSFVVPKIRNTVEMGSVCMYVYLYINVCERERLELVWMEVR